MILRCLQNFEEEAYYVSLGSGDTAVHLKKSECLMKSREREGAPCRHDVDHSLHFSKGPVDLQYSQLHYAKNTIFVQPKVCYFCLYTVTWSLLLR